MPSAREGQDMSALATAQTCTEKPRHKICPCGRLCRKRGTESWANWEKRRYCSIKCANTHTGPEREKRKAHLPGGHHWDMCACGARMARHAKRCRECWKKQGGWKPRHLEGVA